MRTPSPATAAFLASSLRRSLALLLAASSLVVIYSDWVGFGHIHAGAEGVVYHQHHHFGAHRHDAGSGEFLDSWSPESEAPADEPAAPACPEVFLESAFFLGLDLQLPFAIEGPSQPAADALLDRRARPERKPLYAASAPRGPPKA